MIDFVIQKALIGDILLVKYNSGKIIQYDAFKLGCDFFRMSNDAFYEYHGFNFVPHGELAERCKKAVWEGKI